MGFQLLNQPIRKDKCACGRRTPCDAKSIAIVIPTEVEGPRICGIRHANRRGPSTTLGMTSVLCIGRSKTNGVTRYGQRRREIENYSKPNSRKSSRGSSKLQLPNDVIRSRCASIRDAVIFQSRHANMSPLNRNDAASSSSSICVATF